MRCVAAVAVVLLAVSSSSLGAETSSAKAKAAQLAAAHPTREGIEFFEKKIRPVLVKECYGCHSPAKGEPKGKLSLDTREGLRKGGESGVVVIPGDPENSLLIEALRHEGLEMPPKQKLLDNVIDDFVEWIQIGAPDPRITSNAGKKLNVAEARKFWAYQLPKKSQPPEVKDVAWPKSDFDRFILAGLEAKGLKPAPDADRLTLLRRVTFDLTGLPPTAEQVAEFTSQYSLEKAYEALVDRLLASPQFGERWGRHWLDVARYGESTGKERNVPFTQAWRYRDWVIDAVNADKPYNRFVIEQVAGDLLPALKAEQRNAQIIATGFLTLGPKSLAERDRELFLMDQVDDQIDVVTRAVLGTTVACARCHDHKFDPIPTTDYYAMAGIFRSTQVLSGVSPGRRGDYDGEFAQLMPVRSPIRPAPTMSSEEFKRRMLERRLELVRSEHKRLEMLGSRANKKRIDDLEAQIKEIRDELKSLGESTGNKKSVDLSLLAMGVQDRQKPSDVELCVRGDVKDRGPSVPRGVVTVLRTPTGSRINPAQSGRLELANWLVDRNNPLPARVMANRVWYHLFGQGIVESLDNFGALGDVPSHPELLDNLAVQFVDNNWSVKKLIRAIVLSRTYQLSSEHITKNYEVDPGNRLLWRANRRRLDAEEIRDAMLAASGHLDVKRPEGSMMSDSGRLGSAAPESATHRSVYLPLARNAVPEALAVFDVADPSLSVAHRDVTTVATQALFMMNSPFALRQCELMGARLFKEAHDPQTRVDLAYRLVLSRHPTATERKKALEFIREYRQLVGEKDLEGTGAVLAGFCQVLFSSAEFRYLY